MTINYYYLSENPDEEINDNIFLSSGCKLGNYDTLYRQISSNPYFCKDEKGISYEYFLQNIGKEPTIYIIDNDIMDQTKNIVGALFFYTGLFIGIYGICVPTKSEKKYGTLLINKLKTIGYKLGAKGINLSTEKINVEFYKKNGFQIDDSNPVSTTINMTYYITSGGNKLTKNKRRKLKNIKQKNVKTRKYKK